MVFIDIWKVCCERIQQRWVFAIMGFLALMNAYTMRVCLSVAITEMVLNTGTSNSKDDSCSSVATIHPNTTSIDATSDTSSSSSSSPHSSLPLYDWDEKLQGMILSSFYWGYVLTQVPGGLLAEKFGGKHTLGLGILSTAIFTLLTPIAVARGGPTALIVLRILMGLGEGTTFPSMNHLIAQWAPPSERSKIGSLVFAGTVAGTVTGNALSGILIHFYGWTSVFYFFGTLGVIWFMIFSVVCYSSPYEHPFISTKEKEYLMDSMSAHTHRNIPPTPWKHILKSMPLWALTVAFIGQDWGTFTLTSDLPKYMHSVLKFSVKANGIISALPSLFMWLVSILSSWIADWMINRDFMSRTNVRRMFTTIGFMGAAIFIISASYAGCNRALVVILFVIAMATNGTVYPGMKVNTLDLSPNYSGTILALANGIGALSGIVTPYVVGVLAPNQTADEWRIVFWIVFVFYAVTNLIYLIYASGDVQEWNDPDFLIKSKWDQETNKGYNNANNKQTPISNYQLRRLYVH